jgi:hypothetical protein
LPLRCPKTPDKPPPPGPRRAVDPLKETLAITPEVPQDAVKPGPVDGKDTVICESTTFTWTVSFGPFTSESCGWRVQPGICGCQVQPKAM